MLPNIFSSPSMPGAVPGSLPASTTGQVTAPDAPMPVSSPMAGPLMPGPLAPVDPDYMVERQEDGTLLIRIKNPDGTPGVVVKHMPPIKQAGAPAR